jgi:hypothetical protein
VPGIAELGLGVTTTALRGLGFRLPLFLGGVWVVCLAVIGRVLSVDDEFQRPPNKSPARVPISVGWRLRARGPPKVLYFPRRDRSRSREILC